MVKDDYGIDYVRSGSWMFALGMIAWSVVIALVVAQVIGINVLGLLQVC